MMEYTSKRMEDVVSEFIVSTCQLLPKSCAADPDRLHSPLPSLSHEPINHSWFCGSGAELYIRPLNPCIDNIDKLMSSVNMMAFTEDLPVLPDYVNCLADSFECYKIQPYQRYPGFVWLRRLGKMNYNWKYKNMNSSLHV